MTEALPSPVHRRPDCRLCAGTDLELVLALTPTPPANAFVRPAERDKPQPVFPLDLFLCKSCFHLQMLDVVDPRLLFENYVYVSGTSPVFVRHFQDYAAELLRRYAPAPRGPAAIVTANNVFAHIDDLAGVVRGVRSLLAADGVFAFEEEAMVDVVGH